MDVDEDLGGREEDGEALLIDDEDCEVWAVEELIPALPAAGAGDEMVDEFACCVMRRPGLFPTAALYSVDWSGDSAKLGCS